MESIDNFIAQGTTHHSNVDKNTKEGGPAV